MKFRVCLTARDVLQVFDMVAVLKTWPDVQSITILDNDSTFPEFLERLDRVEDVDVIRCENIGPRAAWSKLQFGERERYVVSDGDLDISGLRPSCLTQWAEWLDENPGLIKVGAALRLDDLPDTPLGDEVRTHESQFWSERSRLGYIPADIDTTFAMYAQSGWKGFGPAARDTVNQARHVLWYLTAENMPADWRHYLNRVPSDRGVHWSLRLRTNEA